MTIFLAENTKLNLTALRTPELCWTGNILDSLAILDVLPALFTDHQHLKIADIGTGGGFPLLPLAVMLPESSVTGIDSIRKKIDAIGRIVSAMHLANVTLHCGRVEECGHDPQLREQFDLVTARAVAPINVLLEYCSPFMRPGGYVALWKSLHADTELHESLLARAETSCHLEQQFEYDLGGDWGKRQLLIFKKAAALSQKYPRDVGVPKKEPLR